MKEQKFGLGIFSKRFNAIVIVLALLVSAVPAGFFMAVLPVGAEQTGESSSESGNSNNGETA